MKMCEYNVLYINHEDAEFAPMFHSLLCHAADRMREDGTFERVFYDGEIYSNADILAALLRPGVIPIALFDAKSGDMAGLAWLNGLEGRAARGHFVFFRQFWGRRKSVAIGRAAFSYFLNLKDEGGYLFDVLVGITPANNPLAWQRAVESGAELVGTLPRFCYMAATGESVDAVAVSVTRESMEKKR